MMIQIISNSTSTGQPMNYYHVYMRTISGYNFRDQWGIDLYKFLNYYRNTRNDYNRVLQIPHPHPDPAA